MVRFCAGFRCGFRCGFSSGREPENRSGEFKYVARGVATRPPTAWHLSTVVVSQGVCTVPLCPFIEFDDYVG